PSLQPPTRRQVRSKISSPYRFSGPRRWAVLKQHHRDAAIPAPQIRVRLQLRSRLQEPPDCIVALPPVLAEYAPRNQPGLGHLVQALLYRNPDVPTHSGGPVAVNDLQCGLLFLVRQRNFALQPLYCLGNGWHVRLEIDGFDCVPSQQTTARSYFRALPRATASRASLSAVRRRSVSRLSHSCFPLAKASSIFTLPFLKYILVGIKVRPFCWVLPISLRISSRCMSNFRVRSAAWLE